MSESSFSSAGLRPLDARRGEAVVAFADDPQLAGFLERVDKFRKGPPEDAKSAPHEAFIDVLGDVRIYGPGDRLTERLERTRNEAGEDDLLLVDLECWHPGDGTLAAAWLEELDEALEKAGGTTLDRYRNDRAGLLLMRARVPARAIDDLIQLDQLARVDGVPELAPSRTEAARKTIDELPEVLPPSDDAPLVGMIDSGVKSAHPLIAPALADATTLSDVLPDGEDAHGHGTRVAGLLLHGLLDLALERDYLPPPLARLLSVRVLGSDNRFPDPSVWEQELEGAIRYCHEQGARVINLSIGDEDTRYRGARATPVAGLLDQLARELDVVIVVPTGNIHVAAYADIDGTIVDSYVAAMLEAEETSILDPAPAALALTVGATCSDGLAGTGMGFGSSTRRAIGSEGWVAPFSRTGPGVDGAIKPEMSVPIGSFAWDAERREVVDDRGLGCLSSSGRLPESVLDIDVGTSFAAPIVARIASGVVARYPRFKANLVRALVLQAVAPSDFADNLQSPSRSERRRTAERLVGHGTPRLNEAANSDAHRTVLVAEGSIPMDGTHVYEIPIPPSFFASGGKRGIDVSLCFDPPTRIRRLDYMGCKMEFYLVRGLEADAIEKVFLRTSQEELERQEEESGEADSDKETGADDESESPGRTTPSMLGRNLVLMEPPGRVRSRGANQLARKVFSQLLKEEDGNTYFLVVQCRRRWAPEYEEQQYGLAVCLWREEGQGEIYEEIRARVEIPVELEVQR